MSTQFPDLDEPIARLYEAALDYAPWPAVMSDLATALKLRSASLLIVDHATGRKQGRSILGKIGAKREVDLVRVLSRMPGGDIE